jgi:putative membrane protein
MFYDGGTFMGGMHWYGWIFWAVLIGVIVFYGWGRLSEQRRRPRETPHEALQRRLASGEIAPEECTMAPPMTGTSTSRSICSGWLRKPRG